ncbi:hypothetical protein HYH03_014450 [Edaphochlamys debaryana]|uniref:Beta-glucosidase n=1 Tax=Edaphochlamys debaryana TaxID=47281 RepID=A0A835XQ70_9CHLO|nr:hypothetical protein HYH03_014450 [Edaphochlamys debaryana]|eukprot:KAG2486953.1 hypothetical protein HYH03_014450 [Edaphochlamys debaryana]
MSTNGAPPVELAGSGAPRFLKGCAISVWQNSPDTASQWTQFALKPHSMLERVAGKNPQMRIDKGSPDFWQRYEDDIAAARLLGSNSFRVSLEWSRVMPEGPGLIDQQAVSRYCDILRACTAAGLEPMVTLHHFVHPEWFQRLGGFEKESNIRYFVEWAEVAFRLFAPLGVKLWATFNEPTCAAFTGYIVGIHAPGRQGALELAGRVLLCMLRAHAAAHACLKRLPGGQAAEVGLVHQQIRFEAEGTGALYGGARWTAEWLTHCFGWDVVHTWLLTGHFAWRVPGSKAGVEAQEPGVRPPCDWLGINYYTNVVLDWRCGFTGRPGDVLTDMGWPISPEGLYRAIAHCGELGIPLYITETGIADGVDDRRGPLIAAYWEQLARAVADGHDVRGFYYWTLCDNFEWHLGWNMKFGLFEWTEAPPNPKPHPVAAAQEARAAAARAAAKNAALDGFGGGGGGGGGAVCTLSAPPPSVPALALAGAAAGGGGAPVLQIHAGASVAATATATIISVSPPGTPYWRRPTASATPFAADGAAAKAAEAAVAEAEAGAERFPGRRLRQGSLELVRRFAATPDDLAAARQALASTQWPAVPLPDELRRPTAAARAAAGGPAWRSVRGVLRLALAVLAMPAAVAGAAWRAAAKGAASRQALRAGSEEEKAALCGGGGGSRVRST